ncbi:MAG: ATP-binding cassette domain-containing protein [Erysipelotrichaceae bacterium]
MLELKNIKKTYHIGDIETKALDDISTSFREKEFVAILGKSGSGKTTCLNIIGGLDHYDGGDLIIKGKRTIDFKDKDWDAYRNNSIGFVFQSYNLIMHLSIVQNVELAMTLSGVSTKEKHTRAIEVLTQVGLQEHLHKKPNQLSGGQMQRVAIARALANNPEILLCDEPTGALDTHTSIQIMDLIKQVANERLVIMVTHNPELAKQYADRIIRFEDGKIVSDSNPYIEESKDTDFSLKKTNMSFITALKLSFNNIRTKKGRTFLTAFASSIGIIGIAVILSLSNGFKIQIDSFQQDALSEYPIMISQATMKMNKEDMEATHKAMQQKVSGTNKYAKTKSVELYDPSKSQIIHHNEFSDDYMKYLEKIDPKIAHSVGYTRLVHMNLLRMQEDGVKPVQIGGAGMGNDTNSQSMANSTSMSSMGLSSYPDVLKEKDASYLEKNYDVLEGSYPKAATDLVLVVDHKNRLDYNILKNLGFDVDGLKKMKFEDIVGKEFKVIDNNDYYQKTTYGTYLPGKDYETMYQSEKAITLKISGIVRQKQNVSIGLLASGIAYSDALSQLVIDHALDSDIVKAQRGVDYNIMTMEKIDETKKQSFLSYLGGDAKPFMAMLYPENFESKDKVTAYLDKYNVGKSEEEQVIYTDLAKTMSEMTAGILDGITVVLVAFAAISLVVSLIMICIITYTSVLERNKEIGILKALGARKKDITRVFDAETCILGVFSGLLGVFVAYLCTFPINAIIYNMTDLTGVAQLQLSHAIILVIISTVLTMLGGHIPARMASKKDAVAALRSE